MNEHALACHVSTLQFNSSQRDEILGWNLNFDIHMCVDCFGEYLWVIALNCLASYALFKGALSAKS